MKVFPFLPNSKYSTVFLKDFDFRNKAYQQQQRTWIDEQIKQKEMMKNDEKEAEKAYSTQTHELNRMK